VRNEALGLMMGLDLGMTRPWLRFLNSLASVGCHKLCTILLAAIDRNCERLGPLHPEVYPPSVHPQVGVIAASLAGLAGRLSPVPIQRVVAAMAGLSQPD